mgnify:FL=1|tara:strand:- start:1 stop:126 length:126 start_codon:yes stop_codon:yes gene_type:complete
MPTVNGKKYPYTVAGKSAAKKAKRSQNKNASKMRKTGPRGR